MKRKPYYEDETRDVHEWYMEERTRTANQAAAKCNVTKATLLWRFRKLGLETKSNNTHHYDDLKGRRFHRCVVIEKLPRVKGGGVRWKCLCDCGNEFEAYAQNLKAGNTTACGCGRTGKNKKNWNHEGRSISKESGYVFVRLKGHPRASKAGWVREHIVVMEKKLGRYLTEAEEVHHKNGIRHDNSEDNLELWNKSHPAGARVEDLVEYSLEIIQTYRPEILKSTIQ